MRLYLLDTTPVSGFLFNRPGAVNLIGGWIGRREVVTSVLVYGEVIEYIQGFPDYARRRDDVRRLMRGVYPLAPTYAIMERYAEIRRALRRQGVGLIGDVDTVIAATALVPGLTVVTTDADLRRVPGLSVMLLPRGLFAR